MVLHGAPTAGLRLSFAGLPDTPPLHLSVDGMTAQGPNLSHWPGNRTPPQWKADLSTGICLEFARADATAQRAFLGEAGAVLNDHYDTDGFGSLLSVLRPQVALAREEVLLAAAATGDFGSYQTWRGFAIDRIVTNLATANSPVAAAFAGLEGGQKSLRRYEFLMAHAEAVLDRPEAFLVLYDEELRQLQRELDAGRRGALQRRLHRELGFSAVTTAAPVHRMTLNTLAGAYRVLHTQTTPDGPLHRYHDRTESWFELVTIQPPPRRDLRPLCARLSALETPHDGAAWCCDPPEEPIPELYFGLPSAQEYGRITRELRPSRLPAAQVEAEFVRFFATTTP